MAKKLRYSVPLRFYWDDLYKVQKKYTPRKPDKEIYKILKFNLLNSPLAVDETAEQRELVISGVELWKEDLDGVFLHIYFLEKGLRDFLVNTSLADLGGIREYLYEHGEKKTVEYVKSKSQIDCVNYVFGLHIPFEKDGYGFSLNLFENKSIELFYTRGNLNGRHSDRFYVDLNKKKDKNAIIQNQMFRLAINTIAYMKCFPECVSEGVPKISKPKNEDRSNNNIVFRLSEKVQDIDQVRSSKIPHFRRGHFRMLRSDYYKNKRGHIVYVSETMVKGKAKTIETTPKIKEFANQIKSKL